MLHCLRSLQVAMASPGDEETWRPVPQLQQVAETEVQQTSSTVSEDPSQIIVEDTQIPTHSSTNPTIHLVAGDNSEEVIEEVIDASPVITLRMLVTSKDVGSIIGKAGMTIKAFREQSGARINISNGNSSERLVTITGSKDCISAAFSAITAKIQQDNLLSQKSNVEGGGTDSLLGTPSVSFKIIIQASQCGSLIGKGGARIRDIRESTGASIQVACEALPNSTERTVTIAGLPEAVTRCVEEICNIVSDSPPKGPFIPYKPNTHSGQTQSFQPPRSNIPFQAPYTATFNTATQPTTTTQQMRIPNDLIGCVIGRKGTKIHEIRISSGAMIKIAGNEGDGSDRLVTITGTPESVGLAQYLINSRIHTEVNSYLLGAV